MAELTTNRTPLPAALDSERAVLGAVLFCGDMFPTVTEKLTGPAFHLARHRTLFEAMTKIYTAHNTIDHALVSGFLESQGAYSQDGANTVQSELIEYALSLRADAVLSDDDLTAHIGLIEDAYRRRLLIEGLEQSLKAAYNQSAPKALEVAHSALISVSNTSHSSGLELISQDVADTLDEMLDELANPGKLKGLATGIVELDSALRGFMPGSLNIIGARPKQGKSMLALSVALNVVRRENQPVLFFSLEMNEKQLTNRLIRNVASNPNDPASLKQGASHLNNTLPLYRAIGPITLSGLRSQIRKATMCHGTPALVVVDHLGLMATDTKHNGNRVNEVGEISRSLKLLAMETGIPFLVPCQMNRTTETGLDRKPKLWQLKDSGSIEADADSVILLHRPEFYDPNASPGIVECTLAASRNGADGQNIDLAFLPNRGKITDLIPTAQPAWRSGR